MADVVYSVTSLNLGSAQGGTGGLLHNCAGNGPKPKALVGTTVPQDPTNLRGSYGAADNDARHSLNVNYVWEVPVKEMLHGHGSDYLVQGVADIWNHICA